MTVAQRILDGVAGLAEQDGRRISVSVGLARFPADGASSEELLSCGDRRAGRGARGGPGQARRQPDPGGLTQTG